MISITIPWPPSVNTYYRTVNGRTMISKAGRQYREAVSRLATAERCGSMPDKARLSVRIEAHVPDRRIRDLDNILKAGLDSLTHAGLWTDDSQIDHLSIRRGPIGGMLKVQITEVA